MDEYDPHDDLLAIAASPVNDDARREQIEDFKWVCSTVQGRRFIDRLLGMAGVYRTTFSESHAYASKLEGRRQMGLELLDEMDRVCPERYLQMTEERIERLTNG